jgi:hypothetical protein
LLIKTDVDQVLTSPASRRGGYMVWPLEKVILRVIHRNSAQLAVVADRPGVWNDGGPCRWIRRPMTLVSC